MARIRMVKPEFFDDPVVGQLSPLARLLFIGLWTQADRLGRLDADPRRLKARLFPYDARVSVSGLLAELCGKGMIYQYGDSQGHLFACIRNFVKHQRPHPKEPASVIPPCPRGAAKGNCQPCKNISNLPESGSLDTESGTRNLDQEKPRQDRAAPPTETPQAFERYQTRFVERYHGKPTIAGQKHGSLMKQLLRREGLEEVLRRLDAFFVASDPWIQNSGHTLDVFFSAGTQTKLVVQMSGRADAIFTAAELRHAKDVRDRVHMGCPHEPRCSAVQGCVEAIAHEMRQKAAS